jgi:hypothetical protein
MLEEIKGVRRRLKGSGNKKAESVPDFLGGYN